MIRRKHIIKALVIIFIMMSVSYPSPVLLMAEDVSSTCSEEVSLDYYFSAPLTLVDIDDMSACVLQDTEHKISDIYLRYGVNASNASTSNASNRDAIITAIKASDFKKAETTKTSASFVSLLQHAQLIAFLYVTEANDNKEIKNLLAHIREMTLAYLTLNLDTEGKTELQIELACLVSFAMPFHQDELYRSITLSKDLASRTYIKQANAKSALILGINYTGSIQGQIMTFNQDFAEQYFLSAIELDEERSYVSYLGYVYLANLYFKTHNTDKMKQYLSAAEAMYPDGFLAYIIDQNFFAQGDFIF